jgi:EAL domain-containing protein (putative c-di-GMP-specific phosphodiesterase class I)/GGDEF domain-containing protein
VLVCINIKGFAEILGEFSIEVADQLRAYVAARLARGVAGSERLAHVGGDTFAVWLPAVNDVEHARQRTQYLLATLAALPRAEPTPIVVSGVAGLVYALPSAVSSAAELLRQARVALQVGHRTRQPITVYRAEDGIRGQSAVVLTSELRSALRVGELDLAHNLVVELATGRPLAVGSLPRWLHPGRGMPYSSEWMRVLEQSDLAGRYVGWVLDHALGAQQVWNAARVPVPVVVRLPSQALLDPRLPGVVARSVAAAGTSCDRLVLRFAGSSVLATTDIVERVLVDLVRQRVRLAVGTAGLPLEHLGRVPANEVWIPWRTARLVTVDQEARARVRAVVAFADELGLRVTAEGVLSVDHVTALVRLGVHAGQGPYTSPPLDAIDVGRALRTAERNETASIGGLVIDFPRRD